MEAITANLHITYAEAVRRLDEDHNFDHIVTLGYWDGLGFERPEATDTGDEYVFRDGEHDYADFEAAVNHIREQLEAQETVLVHCQAGVSRSGAACAAVLSAERDISVDDALHRVRMAREEVEPTEELWASAERYAREHSSFYG